MPQVLEVHNIGLKGLSTDPAPWALPPEFITYGVNFRIFTGSIIASGGVEKWSDAPINFNPALPFHVGSTSGDYWLVMGRSGIYSFDGSTWTDVSSILGYGNIGIDQELLWTACSMGAIPVVNNPQAQPEFWAPQQPAQVMQPLMFDATETWTDKGYSAQIFRSHKNFLFALNLTEGGTEFKDSFRWSHPADINGLPPTWDETDQAFLAGKAALGGDGGEIIDGQSLRDSFCIYSEDSIDVLDYTNDEYVWRRRELSATIGLLSRNCIVEVKGAHFILSNGDIIRNDGNKIESIAHDRIRRSLSATIDINNYNRSYAVRNDSIKEIWFCIPEVGEEYPTLAYIYNWADDSWATRQLDPNIAMANYGSQSEPTLQWDQYPVESTWNISAGPWGSSQRTPIDDTIIGANSLTGTLYIMDPGTPDGSFNTVIERTDYPLVSDRQVTTITRVYPHIQGQGTVSIEFGSQDYPGAPVRWQPFVAFNPATTRKIDLRTTGELHAWRFKSIGQEGWRLSGFKVEYEMAGLR